MRWSCTWCKAVIDKDLAREQIWFHHCHDGRYSVIEPLLEPREYEHMQWEHMGDRIHRLFTP